MSEHMSPIPSRIYNSAVGGHVCGPEDLDFGQKVVHLVKYDRAGNEVSFESQVTQANKIYAIHDDFVLSSNVTVPANCVLEFDGGSISGAYTITGQNTGINAGLVKIFNTNVTIAGTWNIVEAYSEWFGAKGDGVTDDTLSINKTFSAFVVTELQDKTYLVNTTDNDGNILKLPLGHKIVSSSPCPGYSPDKFQIRTSITSYNSILVVNEDCYVDGVSISGSIYQTSISGLPHKTCIKVQKDSNTPAARAILKNVTVWHCEIGYDIFGYGCILENCVAGGCFRGYFIHGRYTESEGNYTVQTECTKILCMNCACYNIVEHGFYLLALVYSNFIGIGGDFVGVYGKNITTQEELDAIGYVVYAERCFGINLQSVCSERSYKLIHMKICGGFYIISPYIVIDAEDTSNITLPPEKVVFIESGYGILKNPYFKVSSRVYALMDIAQAYDIIYLSSYGKDQMPLIIEGLVLVASQSNICSIKNANYSGNTNYGRIKFISVGLDEGPTSRRPTNMNVGFQFFDTTLGKPIYWNGTAWVDATGTSV